MNCLKCGKETEAEKLFCEDCLQSMEAYPVKPGTAIYLPKQDTPVPIRRTPHPKRNNNMEEQLSYLKKLVRWMALMLLVAVVVLGLATARLLHLF